VGVRSGSRAVGCGVDAWGARARRRASWQARGRRGSRRCAGRCSRLACHSVEEGVLGGVGGADAVGVVEDAFDEELKLAGVVMRDKLDFALWNFSSIHTVV